MWIVTPLFPGFFVIVNDYNGLARFTSGSSSILIFRPASPLFRKHTYLLDCVAGQRWGNTIAQGRCKRRSIVLTRRIESKKRKMISPKHRRPPSPKEVPVDCLDSDNNSSSNSDWMDAGCATKHRPRYACDFCSKEFMRINDRAKHIRNNCMKNPEAKVNTELTHPYICEVCGCRFKVRKMLSYHIRHDCMRTVTCGICNLKMIGGLLSAKHVQRCARKHDTSCLQYQASTSQQVEDDSNTD